MCSTKENNNKRGCLVSHLVSLVVMNFFFFSNTFLSSFSPEAEETLLIDIASNSEYLSEWS